MMVFTTWVIFPFDSHPVLCSSWLPHFVPGFLWWTSPVSFIYSVIFILLQLSFSFVIKIFVYVPNNIIELKLLLHSSFTPFCWIIIIMIIVITAFGCFLVVYSHKGKPSRFIMHHHSVWPSSWVIVIHERWVINVSPRYVSSRLRTLLFTMSSFVIFTRATD